MAEVATIFGSFSISPTLTTIAKKSVTLQFKNFVVIMKKHILFAIFIAFAFTAKSQTPNQNFEKYQHFRNRLKTEMMYVSGDGMEKASYLPMERRYMKNGKSLGYWADATWWQGHYVSVLATEYYLKKLRGESTDSTLHELRQAITAYNRLDMNAEHCWYCDTCEDLNGFYLRDDVDDGDIPFLPVDTVDSDYQGCGRKNSTSNAPSQDQAWASYLGFALTLKLVDDTALCNEVRSIAKRMVKIMQYTDPKGNEHWQITNPVNGMVIQIEGDIKWLRYAHATIGTILSGEDMHFGRSNKALWKSSWNVAQNNVFISKSGNFRWYGIMALSVVMNDDGRGSSNCYDWLIKNCNKIASMRPDLEQSLIFPHLPLINVVLYGYNGKKAQPKDKYLEYLNSAPEGGAGTYTENGEVKRTQAPWHTLSLFCPWHNKDVGEFNMLDYMLLYNLYQIVYELQLPEFKQFWNQNTNN